MTNQNEELKNKIQKSTETKKEALLACESLAQNLKINPQDLQITLMKTVCKEMKTNEEFITFVSVANKYNLDPLTKEIYAYPDKKGGIVPIVSTDGWTRLMVNHPNYRTHHFVYSDTNVTMPNAKSCPEWCEVIIEKKDGSKVTIREYLDEVFRSLTFQNPWRTHTKRMLRHKTKIQGAREAFGFSGIYDDDEGYRIIEAKNIKEQHTKALEDKKDEPDIIDAQKSVEDVKAKINNKTKTETKKEDKTPETQSIPEKTETKTKTKIYKILTENDYRRIIKIKGWLNNLCNGNDQTISENLYELTKSKNEKGVISGIDNFDNLSNSIGVKKLFKSVAEMFAKFSNQDVKKLMDLG